MADADLLPLATLEQLGKKLGYIPTGAEADRATECLAEASELIRDVADTTWTDDAGQLVDVPARVRRICLDVAYRAFTNPEALTQRSIGDSSKSWDRTGREGGEAVYLTEAEERAIRKAAGGSSFAAVTLASPYGGDDTEIIW